MKIFINKNYEIKAIDFTEDISLIEIDIDREKVFGDMEDSEILNYCYKQNDNGYSIYHNLTKYSETVDEYYRLKVDEAWKKVSILEAENEKLKVEQEQQNEEILVNMLANTEMFEMILGMMPMTLSIEDKNTKNNGGNSMIEVYCTLIIKGVKTIEDVPLVIREQVIERLKQLEVPVK